MKNRNLSVIVVVVLLSAIVLLTLYFIQSSQNYQFANSSSSGSKNNPTGIRLIANITLPNVDQRYDHMAIDPAANLLFIAARGNNSVFVIDLNTKNATHFITGLDAPQGVVYIPENNRLFVSNGGDGTVDVFDVASYALIKTLTFASNADNMRFDQHTGLLYVGFGEGNQSGIGIVNATSNLILGTIPLDGHPEAFELEQYGTKIFVNVPTSSAIEVLDRTNRSVVSKWSLTSALANYPMALDERDHRLFVGFWFPTVLISYDTTSGKIVDSVNTSSDADDLFYDSSSRLILASCGQGFVDVFKQQNTDHLSTFDFIATGPLARTSLFYPEKGELFVAVPQHNGVAARLIIFAADG